LGVCLQTGPKFAALPICDFVTAFAEARRRPRTYTRMIEPGRSIVGNAGVFARASGCYRKEDGWTKIFVIIDAAMNDLIRPALLRALIHDYSAACGAAMEASVGASMWSVRYARGGDFPSRRDRELPDVIALAICFGPSARPVRTGVCASRRTTNTPPGAAAGGFGRRLGVENRPRAGKTMRILCVAEEL